MSDLARIRAALAGRYIVERELGRGGMAAVYLARDLKHGRHVALKVLGEGFTGNAGTERFLREIRTTARLTHPAILPLHDSGEVTGVPFYTMPWVDGESLRDRLERDGALPVERAVEIAACVADALGYAHDAGVTHRDIKPDNILIARTGHIWVADFGLAHALAGSANARLSARVAVGSPHYMSPEQALGEANVGSASDIYALGCVLYELLAGSPPFSGPVASIISRHITEPAPDIRDVRADVPEHVALTLDAALSKDPAQRPPSAFALKAALEGNAAPAAASKPLWRRRHATPSRRGWTIAGGLLFLVAAAVLLSVPGRRTLMSAFDRGPPPDSTTWAVLSFAGETADRPADVRQLLNDALGRWDGITVADPLRVADVEYRSGELSFDDQAGLARELGVGRYVIGDVRRDGAEIHVSARVYDAAQPRRALSAGSVRLTADFSDAQAAMAMLADSLLFGGAAPAVFSQGVRGTTSVPALRAYLAGHAALREWETTSADSLFALAVAVDPGYAQAQLWLAQLRQWTGRDRSEWQMLGGLAAASGDRLNPKERTLAAAIDAMGRFDYVNACRLYSELVSSDPNSFMALYGLGDCLRRDNRVVPDATSPTDWSFRTSAHRAVEAFRRAYQVLPASHKAFRASAFDSIRSQFFTSATSLRAGRSEDRTYFVAAPAWEDDTLAFHPAPLDAVGAVRSGDPASSAAAVRNMRRTFHDVTRRWVSAYPGSAPALEAEAVALEMLGMEQALDMFRRARSAVVDDDAHVLHLLVSELWLRLKRALPEDTASIRAFVHTADSLLADADIATGISAERLASLAALTGRATLAADLARRSAIHESGQTALSVGITAPGRALLVYAAMAGPVDSIRAAEAYFERAIRNTLDPASWNNTRAGWSARAATMAFPVYRSPVLTPSLAEGDYLIDAELAFARGDTGHVRAVLDQVAATRASMPPAGWKVEALYPEAWLLAEAFGPTPGIAILCPHLEAISWLDPGALNDPAAAGTLPLAMLLHSRLLRQTGNTRDANAWSRAVAILWSGADPHLRRTLTNAPSAARGRQPDNTRSTPFVTPSCLPGGP